MDPVLVDTGVWYAMFDGRDQYAAEGFKKAGLTELLTPVVVWPIVYETLNTRFVENRPVMTRFERFLQSPGVEFLDDGPYRDAALDQTLDWAVRRNRPMSLTDWVIRLVLDDARNRIPYLATFNRSDFQDICSTRGIEII